MCGRYSLYEDENEELRKILDRTEGEFKIGEIFPTDKAPIILEKSGVLKPEAVVWGFPGFRGKGVVINTRAETVPEKPMFRRSFDTKRCVIPSSGFFEWSHDGQKTKYQFNLPESKIIYMAGLYQDFGDERRFVIITTVANESMMEIHNRMPIILPKGRVRSWIQDGSVAADLLRAEQPQLIRQKKQSTPPG